MSNVFQQISKRIRGSTFVIFLHFMAMVLTVIGVVHFVEDTQTSRIGIAMLERVYEIRPTIYPITYVTMSLAPQVGQVVFFYMFLVDWKKNWWALAVAAGFFTIDFVADLEARSNGMLVGGGDTEAILVSAAITLGFFTIGSELFLTAGIGLVLELATDSLDQCLELYVRYQRVVDKAKRRIVQATSGAPHNQGHQDDRRQRRLV